jgi:hypothetical protein
MTRPIRAIPATAALAAVLISTAPASAESAEEKYDLKLGKLSNNSFDWSQQPVSVRNTTSTVVDIKVECGFFYGDTLLGANTDTLQFLKPSQTAWGQIVFVTGGANRAECRIVGVHHYKEGGDQ